MGMLYLLAAVGAALVLVDNLTDKKEKVEEKKAA